MRVTWWIVLAVLGLGAAKALAAVRVSLPEGIKARAGWELLAVDFSAAPGEIEIVLQDARGGPAFVRQVQSGGGAQRTWMALPLVEPGELEGAGGWQVAATLSQGGRQIESAQMPVTTSIAASGRGEGAGPATTEEKIFRIVIPSGRRRIVESIDWRSAGAVGGGEGGGGIVFIELPEEDILDGPPALFADIDALLLPGGMRLTQERAQALINVGLRIVVPGETAPGGELSRLVWERLNSGAATSQAASTGGTRQALWATPETPVRRPEVIEPGLANITEFNGALQPAQADASVVAAILTSGPLAILLLLIVRGLFKRRWLVLVASVLAMALASAGVIGYMRAARPETRREVAWQQSQAGRREATGALTLKENLILQSPLFAQTLDLPAADGEFIYPVASTPRAYWKLNHLRLVEGGGTGAAQDGGMRLQARLDARSAIAYEKRSLSAGAGLLAPYPRTDAERARFGDLIHLDLKQGWWSEGGYLRRPAASAPVLFASWAAEQSPVVRSAAQAWYETRFDARHRYFLYVSDSGLQMVDFGEIAGADQ